MRAPQITKGGVMITETLCVCFTLIALWGATVLIWARKARNLVEHEPPPTLPPEPAAPTFREVVATVCGLLRVDESDEKKTVLWGTSVTFTGATLKERVEFMPVRRGTFSFAQCKGDGVYVETLCVGTTSYLNGSCRIPVSMLGAMFDGMELTMGDKITLILSLGNA